MDRIIGIKVDVDTYVGMRNGVPTLLSLFKKYDIPASFFVPMGKDHTGRTVKRVFTRKGFLKKAGRVGVVGTYGIRTLLHGLLLPGPEIAKKNAPLLRKIVDEGHELGIHGLDHVYWHDCIKALSKEKTERELEKAFRVYEEILREKPKSFAAPGWVTNAHALRFFEKKGLVYTSNTRGKAPFFPEMGKEIFHVLEIPSTFPTLDEVVGIAGIEATPLSEYFVKLLTDGLNILTVHTELEGKKWTDFLERFIRKTKELGFSYMRLIDAATELRSSDSDVPACRVMYGFTEGRAGEVCLQADRVAGGSVTP